MDFSKAEQLLYSTIKLTTYKNGLAFGSGTGFFMSFAKSSKEFVPAIVTNKHVIDGCDEIILLMHTDNGNGRPSGEIMPYYLKINEETVIYHPENNIDLCAIPIKQIESQVQANNKRLFYIWLDMSLIPENGGWENFDAIEDVMMIGCPNGIFDEVNNTPIVRKGITATPLSKSYNGRDEFLIDMACFPGSSGSPIFIYNRDGYLDRKNNTYMIGESRLLIVGILRAGPLISNSGEIILTQTPKVSVSSTMHLGYVIKSSQLKILDDYIRNLISNS